MLQYARRNAPGVPLIQADARRFGIRMYFDAVLCTFDSLNHLLSEDDLLACFLSVRSCLRPRGVFFFDLNTDHGYRSRWNGRREFRLHNNRVLTQASYDARTQRARFHVRIEHAGERAEGSDEVVLWQRCHDYTAVQSALQRAGLSVTDTLGLEDGMLVSGSMEQAERLFYICERAPNARGG